MESSDTNTKVASDHETSVTEIHSSQEYPLAKGKVVEVFYDGECPLCRREIDFLKWLDRRSRIEFTDISQPDFLPSKFGLSYEIMMAEIYGRLPDGALIKGVEVFRRLYSAVGFGPLVALTRLPGIRFALDRAYSFFARHRLSWTGRRCEASDQSCRVTR